MPEIGHPGMNAPIHWPGAAACAAALVLTLVLAGLLTPRRWWRRPTVGTLALVGGGTLGFAMLFASLLPAAAPPAIAAAPLPPAAPVPAAPMLRYRVVDDLNLRAAKATGAPRLAVLPAGTLVVRTGAADGDWWRVRARLRGKDVEGWASSLWLRRIDEGAAP
jgi:Bacterial SH3 domain